MLYTETINRALKVAYECHSGQVDKAGTPYIMHPLHVAEQLCFEDEVLTGLLHDCLEDAPKRFQTFYEELKITHPEVARALQVLNRKNGVVQSYSDYIKDVSKNRLARIVKFYDLKHNLDSHRFDGTDKEQSMQLADRYRSALGIIEESEETVCGTDIIIGLDDYDTMIVIEEYPYKITLSRAKKKLNRSIFDNIYVPIRVELEPLGVSRGIKKVFRNESVICQPAQKAVYDAKKQSRVKFSSIIPNRHIIVSFGNCTVTPSEEFINIGELRITEQLI